MNKCKCNTSVQTFLLPHGKAISWFSSLKGIFMFFCIASFVCDENNSAFLSVILPTDQCISYRFLLIRNRIQMK